MRRAWKGVGVSLLLVVVLAAGCTVSALEHAKRVGETTSLLWKAVQLSFAEAQIAGRLTEPQTQQFRALDRQVLETGRAYQRAVQAAMIGQRLKGVADDPNSLFFKAAGEASPEELIRKLADLFRQVVEMAKAFGVHLPTDFLRTVEGGGS